jgi:hypothetical protein
MSWIYTIKQGDHLSSIAKAYGFSDYHKIWNDPNNASLKQLRRNPHVLYPGDQVFIPDKELQSFSKPTDKKHQFVLKTDMNGSKSPGPGKSGTQCAPPQIVFS